jgi:hypothetical protein
MDNGANHKTLSDLVIDQMKQVQDATIPVVESLSEAIARVVPQLPKIRIARPLAEPERAVKRGFDVAERILENQREFALRLVDALAPLRRKVTPKASA